MRLDLALVEREIAPSRQKGSEWIKCGRVFVDGQMVTKPSYFVGENQVITLTKEEADRYVSRGAMKLEAAFASFPISAEGKRVADFGASTGGFTQVLLEHGAEMVYAIDVGHGQLHPSLVSHPSVKNLEGINLRSGDASLIGGKVPLVVGDLSFISLTLILPTAREYLTEDGQAVFLVKPQYEMGRACLDQKGIVRDPGAHFAAIQRVATEANQLGLVPVDLVASPILGGDGNKEFLIYLKRGNFPWDQQAFFETAMNLVGKAN